MVLNTVCKPSGINMRDLTLKSTKPERPKILKWAVLKVCDYDTSRSSRSYWRPKVPYECPKFSESRIYPLSVEMPLALHIDT